MVLQTGAIESAPALAPDVNVYRFNRELICLIGLFYTTCLFTTCNIRCECECLPNDCAFKNGPKVLNLIVFEFKMLYLVYILHNIRYVCECLPTDCRFKYGPKVLMLC